MIKVTFIHQTALGHAIDSKILKKISKLSFEIESNFYDICFPYDFLNTTLGLKVPILNNYDLDFYAFRSHLIGSYEVRKYITQIMDESDALYIQTSNIAFLSLNQIKYIPTIVALDAPNYILSNWGWSATLPYTRYTWLPSIFFEKEVFNKSAKVIIRSNWARDILVNHYKLSPQNIEVIPLPVIIPTTMKSNHLNLKPNILFIGGEFLRKGGPMLLSCFNKYFSNTCELHIVTKANITPQKNVFVYNNISERELDALYRKADIFVFPTEFEPWGRVVAEAMSYGLPVVTTNVAAMPEIIDKKSGFLIEPNNISSLREKIQVLIDNEDLRVNMGKNGREYAKANYDAKIIINKVISLIKEITQ